MYLPRHDTQYEPRTVASPFDCNMAASADVLRFWSLGLKDRNHDLLRHDSGTYGEIFDGIIGNNGTDINDAAHALAVNGCTTTVVYDATDGRAWVDVVAALQAGNMVIAHGDYDQVPPALRGPIDRYFEGLHSVAFARINATGVQVGDGLSEPWTFWPTTVARAYMEKFPGGGYTFLVVRPRKLGAKVPRANVRKDATTRSAILGRITPRSRIHYGGTVLGQSIGGNRRWFRVWFRNQIAYIHSSVAKPA